MTERRARLALAIAGLVLGACHSAAVQAEQAAWIAAPSPESRAELLRAVRTLVGEREVRLAADALTATHVLLLEPAVRDRLDGRVLGRNLEMPERLELVLSDRRCYLVHIGSGERVELRQASCVPAPR